LSQALQALYEGDVERARQLLPPDERLTVFEAAAFGREARLRVLLTDAPDRVTALSDDGFTALHLAVFGGQEGAARTLIEHGADVDACATASFARVRPLGTAAFVGSLELARILLDAGADVDGRSAEGHTALHTAAQNGDARFVRELVARGADPTVRSDHGETPVDLATDPAVRKLLTETDLTR
jgi:ankyrin repeat protein